MLAEFLQNITSKKYESKSTHSEYRKLDKNAVIAAFEGFRQIIDDPMVVSEQPMSYNIADIIRYLVYTIRVKASIHAVHYMQYAIRTVLV